MSEDNVSLILLIGVILFIVAIIFAVFGGISMFLIVTIIVIIIVFFIVTLIKLPGWIKTANINSKKREYLENISYNPSFKSDILNKTILDIKADLVVNPNNVDLLKNIQEKNKIIEEVGSIATSIKDTDIKFDLMNTEKEIQELRYKSIVEERTRDLHHQQEINAYKREIENSKAKKQSQYYSSNDFKYFNPEFENSKNTVDSNKLELFKKGVELLILEAELELKINKNRAVLDELTELLSFLKSNGFEKVTEDFILEAFYGLRNKDFSFWHKLKHEKTVYEEKSKRSKGKTENQNEDLKQKDIDYKIKRDNYRRQRNIQGNPNDI